VLFLHEQLTWQLLTGATLIIVSLAVANWTPRTIPVDSVKRAGKPKQT
jgi:drug/metabolite transporter (DMT)-like permease